MDGFEWFSIITLGSLLWLILGGLLVAWPLDNWAEKHKTKLTPCHAFLQCVSCGPFAWGIWVLIVIIEWSKWPTIGSWFYKCSYDRIFNWIAKHCPWK
jgi:hypothetical protein